MQVWDSARVLCNHLLSPSSLILSLVSARPSLRVIELGSGTGVVGMFFASLLESAARCRRDGADPIPVEALGESDDPRAPPLSALGDPHPSSPSPWTVETTDYSPALVDLQKRNITLNGLDHMYRNEG